MIQIDTREHADELLRITRQLNALGVDYFIQKLDVGDYMKIGNDHLSIDRKKNLQELCGNVTQQHERFQRELVRAIKNDVKLVILCEHGQDIKCLEDVYFWRNPRLEKSPKATTGEQLYKSLKTIKERYGVDFEFCDKRHTAKKIVEILGEETNGH